MSLFNMSSPSPQQSVKPPSRKQRKASPQTSTSSAFVRKALGKKVVSTSQPRRTVTKRPIEPHRFDSLDDFVDNEKTREYKLHQLATSKSEILSNSLHKEVPEKNKNKRTLSSTSEDSIDVSSKSKSSKSNGNQSVASTSIAISKLSLGVPPPQQSVKPPSRKQRKASPEPSTSSAAVKESLVGKRKALPQSAESGGCQAIIRLTDVDVSFLGNKFKKQQKRFVCPFEGCRADFSSFLNLKNHFRKEHGQHDLQKPVDSETNNWRKIQNANSRYDMSTVKLKLRSLLVDEAHRFDSVDDFVDNEKTREYKLHQLATSKSEILSNSLHKEVPEKNKNKRTLSSTSEDSIDVSSKSKSLKSNGNQSIASTSSAIVDGNQSVASTSIAKHGQHDLQKPVDSETNNWRKIQNANSRYDMSTVKLKLRSVDVQVVHTRDPIFSNGGSSSGGSLSGGSLSGGSLSGGSLSGGSLSGGSLSGGSTGGYTITTTSTGGSSLGGASFGSGSVGGGSIGGGSTGGYTVTSTSTGGSSSLGGGSFGGGSVGSGSVGGGSTGGYTVTTTSTGGGSAGGGIIGGSTGGVPSGSFGGGSFGSFPSGGSTTTVVTSSTGGGSIVGGSTGGGAPCVDTNTVTIGGGNVPVTGTGSTGSTIVTTTTGGTTQFGNDGITGYDFQFSDDDALWDDEEFIKKFEAIHSSRENDCQKHIKQLNNDNENLTRQLQNCNKILSQTREENNWTLGELEKCREEYTVIQEDYSSISVESRLFKKRFQLCTDELGKLKTQLILANTEGLNWKNRAEALIIENKRITEINTQVNVNIQKYVQQVNSLQCTINEYTLKINKCAADTMQ
ncbi:hypothetical protein Bhyg_11510 [Pseudolycoriella hygida]|uniref:C2H2-type domain-containing protein n=1 Tax=Pseudolycoriella hygida TaxID=35572 RepID=A0A9Q0MY46_9DIPT|nr:hypothetical protein Bhyg_11510 [Pseudolycoriella hygida]